MNKMIHALEETLSYNGQMLRKFNTDEGEFYIASDLGKVLNIKNISVSTRNFIDEERASDEQKRTYNITTLRKYNNHYRKDNTVILLTRRGVERLLCLSRSPNASDLAKFLNINVYNRFTPIETETIKNITTAFQNHSHELQYKPPGTNYRIDLYFPDHKIAIECDECNHNGRDPNYENNRQTSIEKILGCKFIRYDPHAIDFNIFKVINKIFIQLIA